MKPQTHKVRYVCAPQYELPMEPGFCLVGERGEDGERIAREREERAAQAQQFQQPDFFK